MLKEFDTSKFKYLLPNYITMEDKETVQILLRNPFTMMVSGPTKSGKTTFVERLVKNAAFYYTKEPGKFFYFYNQAEPTHKGLQDNVFEFIEGMPNMEWLLETYQKHGSNFTVIIDDQALNVNKDVAEIFTVGSSRCRCNAIFITQTLFSAKKEFRDISLNSSYIIIFKNPRDQISAQTFFKQFEPGNAPLLLDIFREATDKPHSYLFIDLRQETDGKDRLMSNIFGENEEPPILYRY